MWKKYLFLRNKILRLFTYFTTQRSFLPFQNNFHNLEIGVSKYKVLGFADCHLFLFVNFAFKIFCISISLYIITNQKKKVEKTKPNYLMLLEDF